MSDDAFESWAIVELMGRRRLAGYVTSPAPLEQTDRLRIDIYPGDAATAALTQFVGWPGYCLTPTTEDVCRALAARQLRYQPPVARWELEAPPAVRVDPEDDGDDEAVPPW